MMMSTSPGVRRDLDMAGFCVVFRTLRNPLGHPHITTDDVTRSGLRTPELSHCSAGPLDTKRGPGRAEEAGYLARCAQGSVRRL